MTKELIAALRAMCEAATRPRTECTCDEPYPGGASPPLCADCETIVAECRYREAAADVLPETLDALEAAMGSNERLREALEIARRWVSPYFIEGAGEAFRDRERISKLVGK